MKKIVALLSLLVGFLMADSMPDFMVLDFEKAKEQAVKEKKPMMIMIYTAGCPECMYMEEVVFVEPTTKAYMTEHFVNVALDFKKDKIPSHLRYVGVPTMFFTNSEGKIMQVQIGGTRGNKFLELLQKNKAKFGGKS